MSSDVCKDHKLSLSFNSKSLNNSQMKINNQDNTMIETYFNLFIRNNGISSNYKIFDAYLGFFAFLIKSSLEVKYNLTESSTRKVATYFQYIKKERNNVLIKYGEQLNNFYLILNGKVEILAPIEYQIQLYEKDYLRYLAFLIEYGEYDLVNRVLCQNMDSFCIEILNMNKYGRFPPGFKLLNTIPTYISVDNLFKELSAKERNSLQIKRSTQEFTIEDYLNIVDNVKRDLKIREDKLITVKVFNFKKIKSLSNGQFFGHEGLNHDSTNLNKINSIYLTSKTTELAFINKKIYSGTIMLLMKIIRKNEIELMHSFNIFELIPLEVFERKYSNLLTKHQIKKGCRLISQYSKCLSVFLLKKAEYEISTVLSLKEMIQYILSLYEEIKCDNGNNKFKGDILDLIKKDTRFVTKGKNCPVTNAFYTNKKEIKVLSFTSKEMIGPDYLCSEDNICMFNIDLKSQEGEYLSIDNEIYKKIEENDSLIKEASSSYSKERKIALLQRLIEIYHLKLKIFNKHNKEIVKKIDQLTGPTMKLKTIFSVPKRIPTLSDIKKNENIHTSRIMTPKHDQEDISFKQFAIKEDISFKQLAIQEDIPSIHPMSLPSVEDMTTKFNKITKEISCQTNSTSMYLNSTSPHPKIQDPLTLKQMIYDGIIYKQKRYFNNRKNNIKGFIDISSNIDLSNDNINTCYNFNKSKRYPDRSKLSSSYKKNLLLCNNKTPTSFLNYMTFKSKQIPNKYSKSAVMKYQQSFKRAISQHSLCNDNDKDYSSFKIFNYVDKSDNIV